MSATVWVGTTWYEAELYHKKGSKVVFLPTNCLQAVTVEDSKVISFVC